jgi:outer membrane protein OmpA-like peptidoglycan-associated protein
MSQNNQDDDQNYILGIVGAIILAVLVGAVTLAVSASNSMNEANSSPLSSQSSKKASLGSLSISANAGKITLSGDVTDEKAKMSLINPATLLWGADNVIDELHVKPGAPSFWWNNKPIDVLSKLKSIPAFNLILANNTINGAATVGSEVQKDGLLEGIKNWFTPDSKNNVQVNVDSQYSNNLVNPNTLLNMQVEYATGESETPEAIKPALIQIAEILKDDDRVIHINGHTDNVGVTEENKILSLARAEKIKAFLVTQGVAENKLIADGFGDTKPVGDNATDAGRAQNRRIEFSTQ